MAVAQALTSSSVQPPPSLLSSSIDRHHQQDQELEHSVIVINHDTPPTTPSDESSNEGRRTSSNSSSSSSSNSSNEHSSDSNDADDSSDSSSSSTIGSSRQIPGGYPEFNQNYDEQSDASYPAQPEDGDGDAIDDDDDDGLFDDDDAADERAKQKAIAAAALVAAERSQNDQHDDDDYDDDYDYDEPPPTRAKSRPADTDDDAFRSDDTRSAAASGSASSAASSFTGSARRKTPTRLGSNDAIKFIDTPHGKVGFVYQAPSVAVQSPSVDAKKTRPSAVDADDDYDDDNVGYTRRKSAVAAGGLDSAQLQPQQRITPVLTADGKVALLYRGASDSGSTGKYEPIRNLSSYEEAAAPATESPTTIEYGTMTSSVLTTTTTTSTTTTVVATLLATAATVLRPAAALPTVRPFARGPGADNTEENAILPNNNRPLSEVLGIKKNQFTQFRIADHGQPGDAAAPPPPLPPADYIGGFRRVVAEEETSNRIPGGGDTDVMRSESGRSGFRGRDEEQSQIQKPLAAAPPLDADDDGNDDNDLDTSYTDALSKTEVVNLAIIPAFDSDLLAIQQQEDRRAAAEAAENGGGSYPAAGVGGGGYVNIDAEQTARGGHYRHRTTQHRRKVEDLSAIHCAMQAMVAIAALATVFGMLGAYFKTRVLDQLQVMHWWEMVGVRYWVGLSRRGGVVL